MVFVHKENQVKLQPKCAPTGCLVTGIHAHRAGSVGQHSHARKFHQQGFGHIQMCLLQHFQDPLQCLLGALKIPVQMIATYTV